MVNRARTGGGARPDRRQNGQRQDPKQQKRGDSDRPRQPRKCANCGKEHEQRACPLPPVAVADRACWTCGKKGHSNRDCPDRAKGAVKAIEDIIPFFGTIRAVTDDFIAAKKVVRPTPRGASLGDFVPTATRNRFGVMSEEGTQVQPIAFRKAEGSNTNSVQPQRRITSRPHPTSPSQGPIGAKIPKAVARKPAVKPAPQQPKVTSDEKHAQEQLVALENAVIAAIKEHKQSSNSIGLVSDTTAIKVLGKHVTPSLTGVDMPSQASLPTQTGGSVNLIFDDDDDEDAPDEELVAMASEKIRVGVAADSGATDNVIGLDDLPAGVVPEGPPGPPFSNASGGAIKKFGKVVTLMENADGKVGCGWTACAVTRPLHSVSKVCGPEEGPGVQDFMFNNRIGVVMPPGLVDLLLKHIKPVARYPRRGGLYVGDFEM